MNVDKALIKKAAQGDEKAFVQLVNETYKYVFSIVSGIIGDYHETENIVQDIYLIIYLYLPKYRNEGFKTWLGRIATNTAIDHKRKRRPVPGFENIICERTKTHRQSITPEEIVIHKDEIHRLYSIINMLPKKYQDTINKFYIKYKNTGQIAIEDGVSRRTIESRLYRGRKMIERAWKEENEK